MNMSVRAVFDRARESARRKARELREMILTDNPYCALTIVLGAVLSLLFDGLQASFSDYVFKFASKNRWFRGERSVSAELNAAFWVRPALSSPGRPCPGRAVSVLNPLSSPQRPLCASAVRVSLQ